MCDNCLDNDTILEATTGGGGRKKKYVRLSIGKDQLTLKAWSDKYRMKLKDCKVTVRDPRKSSATHLQAFKLRKG